MHLNLLVDYLNAEWIVHRSALTDPSFNPVLAYFVHTALLGRVDEWKDISPWIVLERTPTWPPPQINWSWWWFEAPQVVPTPYTCLNLYILIFCGSSRVVCFSGRYCLGIVGRSACNPIPCSSLGCRFPPGHGISSSSYNCGNFEPLNLAGPPILRTHMFTPAMDYFRVPHRQNLRKKASARRTQLVLKSPPDKVTWRKTNCSVGGLRE